MFTNGVPGARVSTPRIRNPCFYPSAFLTHTKCCMWVFLISHLSTSTSLPSHTSLSPSILVGASDVIFDANWKVHHFRRLTAPANGNFELHFPAHASPC